MPTDEPRTPTQKRIHVAAYLKPRHYERILEMQEDGNFRSVSHLIETALRQFDPKKK